MARNGEAWKAKDMLLNTQQDINKVITKYTMEAWCRENPELCAHIILHCYNDEINALDVAAMKTDLIKLFRSKDKSIMNSCLEYKLYDQRGVQLQVR